MKKKQSIFDEFMILWELITGSMMQIPQDKKCDKAYTLLMAASRHAARIATRLAHATPDLDKY